MSFLDPIVEKATGLAVAVLGHQVGYIIKYKSNCENLRSRMDELSAARERVQQQVREAEDRGDKIYTDVQRWLENVDEITEKVNNFLEDKHQAKVKCGFCPNPWNRHKLIRESTKLVERVVEFYVKKDFPDGISYRDRQQEVFDIPTEDCEVFDSRRKMVENIVEKLRGPDINVIGVYGIGGVGKTTLMKEVYRQAKKEKLFNDMVMVDVKKNPELERLQKEITQKLGLVVAPENDTLEGRQCEIRCRMKNKRTLVILDDVWGSIDLKAVGIPNQPKCKILMTSRSGAVFSSDEMRTQEDLHLRVLDEEETWKLFEKTAGDVVQDPTIRTVAKDIAEKCGGLPVLIVTVASSLKKKDALHSWEHALTRLKSFDPEDLTENAYSTLKWSYDQLDNEDVKKLFLLFAVTARGNYISMEDALKYSLGLGWFKNVNTKEARDAFLSLVDKLLDFCLLTDTDFVKIHDLVRDVAIRIAAKDHHMLSRAYGDEFEEWPNKDFFQKCSMIFLLDYDIPELPKVLECPELKLFRLCSNEDHSLEISLNFFDKMKKLEVLDLTNLTIRPSLPTSVRRLSNLQSLCLHRCVLQDISLVGKLKTLEILSFVGSEFKHLPEEIGQLSHLRILDLTNCSELEVIFPKVISSLKRLEDLRMKNSFNQWEAEGVQGRRRNACLSELKNLSQLTALAIHIRDANILPAELFSKKLDRYQILIGDEWKWDGFFNNKQLKLKLTRSIQMEHSLEMLLKRSESLYLDVFEGFTKQFDTEDFQQVQYLHVQNNAEDIFNEEVELPNLISLTVLGCTGLRFLLSSSTAKSLLQLKHLEISKCDRMEEIVSTKETSEISEENPGNMFCKLGYLELNNLPNLTWFCCSGGHIEFPFVEEMKLKKCAKLETFVKSVEIHKEIKERDSMSLDQTVVQYYLFDEKVRFPRLQILSIKDLPPKFTTIWHTQLHPDSFCRLKYVRLKRCPSLTSIFVPSIMRRLNALNALDISYCKSLQRIFELRGNNVEETFYCQKLESIYINMCKSLKNVFPVSVAKGLQLLKKLTLGGCEVLEEIIAKEEGPETTAVPRFLFPKITALTFEGLPLLRSLYPGNHASMWPLLKTVEMRSCDQVDIFAVKSSSYQTTRDSGCAIKQPFFLIEKGSFSKLEKLVLSPMDLWYGPLGPAGFFSKLKSIEFCEDADEPKQSGFLQICQNTSGTLPLVRRLRVSGMLKQHLSQPAAGPVFPNLEILVVERCQTLENLMLSTISFQNLKVLEVTGCRDLKYLITYPVAKRLVHLATLKVKYCVSLTEIVTSDGDNDDAEGNYDLDFSGLQYVELCYLERLKCFYPGIWNVRLSKTTVVKVTDCPIRLKISHPGLLRSEADESNRPSRLVSTFSNGVSQFCIFFILVAFFFFSLFYPSPM